jgi:hypothetical protein
VSGKAMVDDTVVADADCLFVAPRYR